MKICIFCGAASSNDPEVNKLSLSVMKHFKDHNTELIYGGASIGVMGDLANELMNLGGEVTGIIPRQLMKKEVAHAGLKNLHVTVDMHERKKMMYQISDAFLIFPGGMGTMDEMFEILTWRQLGLHSKPVAILNINGYYDHLLKFLDQAVASNLVKPQDRELLFSSTDFREIWKHFQEKVNV